MSKFEFFLAAFISGTLLAQLIIVIIMSSDIKKIIWFVDFWRKEYNKMPDKLPKEYIDNVIDLTDILPLLK